MNKKLRSTFMSFTPSAKCCNCKKDIDEGYTLSPLTNDTWKLMEKKYGAVSNWTVGECCFGGYCGANKELDADDWFELFIE